MTFTYQVRSAERRHVGRKRSNNEDFTAFFEPDDPEEFQRSGCLYIVADGVGGAAFGERASRYAAQKVLYEYYNNPQLEPGERLRQAMHQASSDIHLYASQNDIQARMATTMVAAAVYAGTLTVANVGDSRAYLIRDGEVLQITRDHSIVGEMVRDGVLTEEEAFQRKQKNPITRSLGGETDVHVDIFAKIPLQQGDKLLLCSDGLTRYARRVDIARLVGDGTLDEIANSMVEFANRSGGADNISVILVSIEAATGEVAVVARGPQRITPTPVDWDTLVTESEVRVRRQPLMQQIPKKYIPLLLVALVLACGLSTVSAIIIVGKLGSPSSPPLTLTTTSSGVDLTYGEMGTPILTLTQTPPLSPTITFTSAITLTPDQTLIEPSTIAQTDIPAQIDNPTLTVEVVSCSYTIQPGDSITIILDKLEAQVDDLSMIKCAEQNNGGCEFNAQNEDLVIPGWVLVIPNADRSQCSEYGEIIEPLQ